ncbi:glycoside hydrolase family 38 N-terminal domain-containing protein [Actinoplanes aureus]|uniref:Alpha-mannosidase n=1 Tax=Actinoplanes aureus TaxID=2792083 RepID=A0A931CFC8_9ACTN|nr:glycoside hydrolase family 38 C-terminal domain-containing protein [Actinoplanes aureus]MBG0566512.1 alpha-mannosidase [Actinoplanes aureus]
MRIVAVTSTELFVGDPSNPRQLVRVELDGLTGPAEITIEGPGLRGSAMAEGQITDVPITTDQEPNSNISVRVTAGPAVSDATVTVAEPGWTVWMISHFHYDPVWWNTQAAYTATWDEAGPAAAEFRAAFQHAGFDLVREHMETARRDPDYRFVLAEVDYLKPYWDAHPADRAYLRRLLSEGRLEIMGGTYNEPNTNLTSAESTVRNLVHGAGYQRGVLGGDPRTAWQLDAFGHDPQFPGLVAAAGLDSSSWARGPYHQWGPMLWTHEPKLDGWGDPSVMQFTSEFEWLSPSGDGVLTHYMPAHYSAGWQIDSKATLADAEESVYHFFLLLKRVAATRNVLLPVGTDYTPPAKWITEIQRDWNARYVSPRFVCGLPKEFFAAVRSQRSVFPPQTRDMNPVYTGKDVSFIDTKQAQREAESLLVEAETFATIAAAHGAGYPHAPLDRAWRQLVFGAHHDAITGSESDQVYLDLLTGWREAWEIAHGVRESALKVLAPQAGTGRIAVFNPSAWPRTDVARVRVSFASPGTSSVGVAGAPSLLENATLHPDGGLAAVDVVFRAADVPPVGYRTFAVEASPSGSWAEIDSAPVIANEFLRVQVDPTRGGCVTALDDVRTGRSYLVAGDTGNELRFYDEYPAHPRYHEGPWHLLPKGPATHVSSQNPASVRVERSPLGSRLTVTGTIDGVTYTQRLTLWDGSPRLDCSTTLDGFTGADRLARLRWPAAIPGGLPVSEVGAAVVGRGFAHVETDTDSAPWTLDNPAQNWFALSHTARVDVSDPSGARLHSRAVSIAEVITSGDPAAARDLVVALVRQGVTATTSVDTGPRYGRLAIDSNLPDVRIAVGGPSTNAFTAAVLATAPPEYAAELDRQLAASGSARLWIPALLGLTEVWQPNADLTDVRALPVLVVAGDLSILDGSVLAATGLAAGPDPDLDLRTVALLNRGIPGFAVDTSGALHLSLLRSCTGWPSGVWIDPPRRTAPDGSNFQQQHWTHTFEYAVVAGDGDWRDTSLVRHGQELNHPLTAIAVASGPDEQKSFVSVTNAVLAAFKPAGNPLAAGRQPSSEISRITARLYEAHGRDVSARLELWTPTTDPRPANLLEEPSDAGLDLTAIPLPPSAIRTLTFSVAPTAPAPAAPADEPPAYARYWLHNTGPAPTGNLPLTVHVDPPLSTADGSVRLTVTVASSLAEQTATGSVTLGLPDGWTSTPATVPYDLAPGAHQVTEVEVTPAAAQGCHWITARLIHDGRTVEDVARVLVGTGTPETVTAALHDTRLLLKPGDSATLGLDLSSDAAGPILVHAQLISPWHTWELFPTVTDAITLHPGAKSETHFPVRVPPGHPAGTWWAMVKLAHGGRLHYTAPVIVEVQP